MARICLERVVPPRGVITRRYQALFSRKCDLSECRGLPLCRKNTAISAGRKLAARMRNEREFYSFRIRASIYGKRDGNRIVKPRCAFISRIISSRNRLADFMRSRDTRVRGIFKNTVMNSFFKFFGDLLHFYRRTFSTRKVQSLFP